MPQKLLRCAFRKLSAGLYFAYQFVNRQYIWDSPAVYTVCVQCAHWVKYMQDYETSQDNANSLDDESGSKNHLGEFLRTLLKKIVVFVCFGPGVLGVVWLIGRLFKR
jgi:hypothetical protein